MEQPIHTRILAIPPHPQDDCPLFNRFPAEIREHIFTLALADFPDPDAENRYESDTYYTRPAYFAPRKSDTRLLRTCRAVYNETWFLPFIMREQTHWLTSDERMPPECMFSLSLSLSLSCEVSFFSFSLSLFFSLLFNVVSPADRQKQSETWTNPARSFGRSMKSPRSTGDPLRFVVCALLLRCGRLKGANSLAYWPFPDCIHAR